MPGIRLGGMDLVTTRAAASLADPEHRLPARREAVPMTRCVRWMTVFVCQIFRRGYCRAVSQGQTVQTDTIETKIPARLDRLPGRAFRPGAGAMTASPGMSLVAARPREDRELDRGFDAIVAALDQHGPSRRDQLAQMAGARYWGPGRFPTAVPEAAAEGRVRRLSRSTLAPARHDDRDSAE